jgi:hypothetical protein
MEPNKGAPAQRMVKGSVILDMVKIIRALDQLPWDQRLRPEDFEIVNGMVMPKSWYPIDAFMRMGLAVFELAAGSKPELVFAFGRQAMQGLFEGPYRPFLDKGDPFEATQKFLDLRRSMFNFSSMKMEKTGERGLRVEINEMGWAHEALEEGLEVFSLVLDAHFEKLIELNGGREVKVSHRVEPRPDDTLLFHEVSWT